MNVKLITTRECHCSDVERELQELGVAYERLYAEEHAEVVARFDIRHCPVLVIDGARLVSIPHGGMRAGELARLLGGAA